ncbi:MAG: hypothetical protein V1847_03415, partial [Candidatus Diapherotrites archaeon]
KMFENIKKDIKTFKNIPALAEEAKALENSLSKIAVPERINAYQWGERIESRISTVIKYGEWKKYVELLNKYNQLLH